MASGRALAFGAAAVAVAAVPVVLALTNRHLAGASAALALQDAAERFARTSAEVPCSRSSLRTSGTEVRPMYETGEELGALQELLDASYSRAGSHLRSIWGQEARLDAQELSAELTAVQVLDLATVTPRGEPRVAPVDGLFFRGQFWFGSAESSARFRNIRANPAVSAAVTRGLETFLVIVHGYALETDPRGPEAGGFADYAREVYDFDWDAAHPTAPYAWIDARTMLAFGRR